MTSVFERRSSQTQGKSIPGESVFKRRSKQVEQEEPWWKNVLRTASQVPQGIAEATSPGIATGLWHLAGQGESLDPEEIERIRDISEREGIPFDEDAYMEAAQNAAASIPTVSNIASGIESRTGLPLEPKTGIQKGLRLASSAYKFQGGPASQRAAAGITAPVASQGLQQVGVPEPLAELAGLGVGGVVGSKTPGINLTKTKPSGMPERGFERLKEPTEVPAKKIQQINDKLETDFKTISDEIIKDSPIGETAENLKNDPRFKRESKELLDQAQILANDTPGTIPSMNYKQNLLRQSQNQMKGFTLNEYKKNYLKFMKEAVENVIPENVTHGELVEQYRENNRSLGEYFEPGSSKALNRAKKDVLLDQNRAIASTLEESNPELSKVFKEGNERWTKIMDAETVDNFVSDMFPEGKKVDFKHMKNIFDDPNYQRIFKRSLGEKGAKGFEQAVEDMLTAERPYKMMREAQDKGFGDVLLTAKAYLFNPKLGYAKAGFDALRWSYRKLFNATLDEPRIGFNFTKAVNELKQGNFKAAEQGFKEVQAEVMPKEKPKELGRHEEPIEVTPEEIKPKQIEHKANLEESKKEIKTFTTEKGSSYEVNEDGTTTRNKAYRPEHGEKEQGIQPQSEKTWYLSKEDADKLGEFQTQGAGSKRVIEFPDGRLGVMYETGKNAGKVEARTVVTPELSPKEGLIPVESFEGGKKVHFGNKIKEVTEIPKKKGNPEEKQHSKSLNEEKKSSAPWERIYTREDFPTLKEAQNHLDRLYLQAERGPESFRNTTMRNIENLEELVQGFKNELPKKSEIAKKNVQKKREERKKASEKSALPEKKLDQVKRQDISKQGLKTQKAYLLEQIKESISNPPKEEKVTFDVPGDGIFRINNNETALKKFYENIEKRWPDKPYRRGRSKASPNLPPEAYKDYEIAQEKKRNEYLGQSGPKKKKS